MREWLFGRQRAGPQDPGEIAQIRRKGRGGGITHQGDFPNVNGREGRKKGINTEIKGCRRVPARERRGGNAIQVSNRKKKKS